MDEENSTILVADDENSLREICCDALEEAGYKVLQAQDGLEALDLLHNQNKVDLVLSDMRMPGLDGMQLLEKIVQEKLDVDFLVMTGFGTIETAVEIMKKGALDYLPKPFDIVHLLLKVEKALEQRNQRKEKKNLTDIVRVLKLSKDLNNQLELSPLLNEFMFHLERNFASQGAGIFLKHDEQSQMQLARARGKLVRSDPKIVGLTRKICNIIVQKQQSMLIDPYMHDMDDDLQFLKEEKDFDLSIMAAPLFNKDRKIGAVVLLRTDLENLYTQDELQLLTVFASQVASVIENAKLYGLMREMNMEVIRSFAQAVEAKDIYTRGHSDQVATYAVKLGRRLGMTKKELDQLYIAGIVHDIGKIGVPDMILNKPDRLTDEEYAIMKKHPEVGRNILAQVGSLKELLPIIYHHHERIDGMGYPLGLKDDEIPYMAKLISVVDAFEAMTSDRAYRKAMSLEEVADILMHGKGSQWDNTLVEVWLEEIENQSLVKKKAFD